MKKRGLMCSMALLAATMVPSLLEAAAPSSILWVRDIDISALESQPAGICVAGNDAFVVGIGNRRVVKITNATQAGASAATFATTVAGDGTPVVTIPWGTGGTGEGLVSVDFKAPDQLLVSGDVQAGDGKVFILNTTSASLVAEQGANLDGGGATRVGATAWYGTGILGIQSSATNYWTFPTALNSVGWTGQIAGELFIRDIAVGASNTAYLSYGDPFFTGTKIGFHISKDLDASNSIDGNTNTASFYQVTGSTFYIYQGIGVFTYSEDSKEYVILPVVESGQVHIVDPTDSNNKFILSGTNVQRPSDAAVATVGGIQYLLLTQTSAHNSGAKVSVFQIQTGPSDAEGWEYYN